MNTKHDQYQLKTIYSMYINVPVEFNSSILPHKYEKHIESTFKDVILDSLNCAGLFKIEKIKFIGLSTNPQSFTFNLNFNIDLSLKIVHPTINYETIMDFLSDNWNELERLVVRGY